MALFLTAMVVSLKNGGYLGGGGQISAKKACRVEIRPFLNDPKHKLKVTKAFERLRSRFVEPTQQRPFYRATHDGNTPIHQYNLSL